MKYKNNNDSECEMSSGICPVCHTKNNNSQSEETDWKKRIACSEMCYEIIVKTLANEVKECFFCHKECMKSKLKEYDFKNMKTFFVCDGCLKNNYTIHNV